MLLNKESCIDDVFGNGTGSFHDVIEQGVLIQSFIFEARRGFDSVFQNMLIFFTIYEIQIQNQSKP